MKQVGDYDYFHDYHESQLRTSQDNPSESLTYDRAVNGEQEEDEQFPLIASISTGCRVSSFIADWST